MAKVAFSKLGLKVNNDVKIITYNEQNIEVRQYLPMEERAGLVSNVINLSSDESGFYNPLKVKVYLTLETVYNYTNLTFTEKMKENEMKLYDILIGSGLFAEIVKNIPTEEWNDLQNSVWHIISNIYDYRNSVLGILDTVASDYSNLDLDANTLTDKILNPESLAVLKELMPLAQ